MFDHSTANESVTLLIEILHNVLLFFCFNSFLSSVLYTHHAVITVTDDLAKIVHSHFRAGQTRPGTWKGVHGMGMDQTDSTEFGEDRV